jgi:non-heme chloroperoxidase
VSKLVLAGAPGPPAGNPVIAEAADGVAGLEDPIDPEFVREFQASTTERRLPPGRLDTFVAESLKLPAPVWRAAFGGCSIWTFPRAFAGSSNRCCSCTARGTGLSP